ncbi:MAG: hypothetical protein AAGG07_14630 [Planctomycetota bacterium]
MLFTGHAELTVDAKGRLAIPAKYRNAWEAERDGSSWISIPWPTGIIRLYTERAFEALASQGEQSLTPDPDEAELEAQLFGLAEPLNLDSAGRVLLPKTHLRLTGISGEVVVVGARNRLEVRERAAWMQEEERRFQSLPALVARIEARKRRE